MLRLDLASAADARQDYPGPVSAILEPRPALGPFGVRVLALGPTREIASSSRFEHLRAHDARRRTLVPALVNAHAHLDLTHVGPAELDPTRGFAGFVDLVRARRASTPGEIAASVRGGIELSLAGGVLAVGDIAGAPRGVPSTVPYEVLSGSVLAGVSYLEFFAIGRSERDSCARVEELARRAPSRPGRVGLGLQPHATNTVTPAGYRFARDLARELGLPLATHLAETLDEREFIGAARGPQRRLLEGLGAWDDSLLEWFGRGRTPVAHLVEALGDVQGESLVLAHVADASDADLDHLADLGASVAYCPRAHEYFRSPEVLGPHRYREMLARGIGVALGTDSIINLPADADRLSTLDEARLLRRRDGLDPRTLLGMATTAGARALGLPASLFLLREGGECLGLLTLPGGDLTQALDGAGAPTLVDPSARAGDPPGYAWRHGDLPR